MKVDAYLITDRYIYYKCPRCFSRYRKDGQPYARSKPLVHVHGNPLGDMSDRLEDRVSHCANFCDTVYITINDKTLRG